VDQANDVLEGVEIKHRILIDLPILLRAEEKIKKSNLKRYYILTTHENCNPEDDEVNDVIKRVYIDHGCQIIVNGVYHTIRYYLRLLCNPTLFIDKYSQDLSQIDGVTKAQLESWEIIREKLIK
jgi:DNA (cytosine-5)-methyltransferase 1